MKCIFWRAVLVINTVNVEWGVIKIQLHLQSHTRKKQWETSNFCSFQQNVNSFNILRDHLAGCKLLQQSQKAPCKIPSMGAPSEKINNMRNFNGFCCFIVIFITWSYSCFLSSTSFNNTGGVWTYTYLQTSLAICTLICFREIGPQESSTGWSEGFKGILKVCGTGIVRRDRGEVSLFSGMLDSLRDKRRLKQENKTGWLCAHMSTFSYLPRSATTGGFERPQR